MRYDKHNLKNVEKNIENRKNQDFVFEKNLEKKTKKSVENIVVTFKKYYLAEKCDWLLSRFFLQYFDQKLLESKNIL